ncbi:MAG: 2-polyprenylphenol 6-hydroxylase [Alphaproteobacteria bacterium]
MSNFFRLIQIICILFKHNAISVIFISLNLPGKSLFKFFQTKKSNRGRNLAKAFEELGPIYIKLGQTLSTRPDIVGENIAFELSMLRDKLPPFATKAAIDIIEYELGGQLSNHYYDFDPQPIAAASIAQVHKATTHNGQKVAVKILRPNIEEIFSKDIKLFKSLAALINKKFKNFKRLKLEEVLFTFEQSIILELDLRFEAAAASELKENLKNDNDIYIPSVEWDKTSKRVLTIEWIEGIKIEDHEEIIKRKFNTEKIAANIAISFFNQAYRDGLFHADMHPGNLLINEKGQIVLIDFGIMGRLDKKTRIYVAEILDGFLKRDYLRVARIHFKAGYIPSNQSLELFAQACRSIGEPIVGLPVNRISIAKLLAQLFKITKDFSMETQPQLLLLQKTMMMVEGVGTMLNPNVNMWQLAEPWIYNWAKKNISFDAKFVDTISEIAENLFYNYKGQKTSVEEVIYLPVKNNYVSYILIAIISSLFTVIFLNFIR